MQNIAITQAPVAEFRVTTAGNEPRYHIKNKFEVLGVTRDLDHPHQIYRIDGRGIGIRPAEMLKDVRIYATEDGYIHIRNFDSRLEGRGHITRAEIKAKAGSAIKARIAAAAAGEAEPLPEAIAAAFSAE